MPSLRKERETAVAALTEDLKGSVGLVVAGYVGVKTPELNDLRDKLRPINSRCVVVKNTLAKLAMKGAGIDAGLDSFFDGQSTLVLQKGDTAATMKILVDFEKAHANFKIRAGRMEGKVVSLAEIRAVASLPPRPILLATMLCRMQGPLQGFHTVLSSPMRYLLNALDQVAKKKEAVAA
jgi:large subunit ribosomal protein L10